MQFSTPPEIDTLEALAAALEPRFRVSEKVRVMDCVEATAAYPRWSAPVGPTAATWLMPAMRELAGPFGEEHRWLERGDWDYGLRAHFDFVVQEGLASAHPSHPLFAVEFDGITHRRPDVARRDRRKNRLCAAAGLPLLRIDASYLARRERLTVIRWLAETWAAYRDEMPRLIEERDEEVDAMSEAELMAAGDLLLLERPDLDVELLFRLRHPFPAVTAAAARLAQRHAFSWPLVGAIPTEEPRWRVTSYVPPVPSLEEPYETWHCEVTAVGPHGEHTIAAKAIVRTCYELREDSSSNHRRWPELFAGNLPCLPAGPWHTAPSMLGESLVLHNVLLEVESFVRRAARKHRDTP